MDTKSLRREVKKQRINLELEQFNAYNSSINKKIINSEIFNSSKVIYCYCSVNNEVDLTETIFAALNQNKIVALPKTIGNEMIFVEISSLDDLVTGQFNIREPRENKKAADADLIFVPGLAFTKEGKRIGYGGGYYDKYLSMHNCHTVGVAFDFQIFDDLETKDHDVILDEIITN